MVSLSSRKGLIWPSKVSSIRSFGGNDVHNNEEAENKMGLIERGAFTLKRRCSTDKGVVLRKIDNKKSGDLIKNKTSFINLYDKYKKYDSVKSSTSTPKESMQIIRRPDRLSPTTVEKVEKKSKPSPRMEPKKLPQRTSGPRRMTQLGRKRSLPIRVSSIFLENLVIPFTVTKWSLLFFGNTLSFNQEMLI
uniref:Uncharacterized protein n=1 Tax=Bursaphelenchus xylophilus TaxID=6326 RepID=A0A1I7RNI1_BURXY